MPERPRWQAGGVAQPPLRRSAYRSLRRASAKTSCSRRNHANNETDERRRRDASCWQKRAGAETRSGRCDFLSFSPIQAPDSYYWYLHPAFIRPSSCHQWRHAFGNKVVRESKTCALPLERKRPFWPWDGLPCPWKRLALAPLASPKSPYTLENHLTPSPKMAPKSHMIITRARALARGAACMLEPSRLWTCARRSAPSSV